MRYCNENLQKSFSLSLFICLTALFLWITPPVVAQNSTGFGPEMFEPIDTEKMAYDDNKQGCGMKFGMFVMMAMQYKEGKSVEEASRIKLMEPLVEKNYALIREDGIEKATLDQMKEYQNCVKTAPPHKNASREYDFALVHEPCAKLSGILLDALSGIKNRKKADTIMRKYANKKLDMEGTAYGKIPDAEILFIGTLYNEAKEKEYKDVVEMASGIVVGCYQ